MNADLQNSQINFKPCTSDFNMKGQYQGNSVAASKKSNPYLFHSYWFIFQVLNFLS